MSTSRSQQGPPESSPGEHNERLHAVPDLPHESTNGRESDERIAPEVRHQEVIEATFERAEAYERLGDFERALEWLDRAAPGSGGLRASYRAKQTRYACAAAFLPRPVGGDWKGHEAMRGDGTRRRQLR